MVVSFNDRGENHRPVESYLQTVSLWKVSGLVYVCYGIYFASGCMIFPLDFGTGPAV